MILNVEMYNKHIRQTKALALSAGDLENRIKDYPYEGEGLVRDEKVEAGKLPPYILTFYSMLFQYGTIPSPQDLMEQHFAQEHFCYLPDGQIEVTFEGKTDIYSFDGMIARLQRSYPSLIRDLHFYLMACESGLFDSVRYSFQKDYYEKIDIQVLLKDKWYNVGLCLGTKRSLWYKFKKQFRHRNQAKVIYVELHEDEAKRCGDYNLYTLEHIQQLYRRIS